ncbi:hypothetical protein [Candidatus Ichthyocystis hellenicum]|uniref:hypothetical protein n=1 Tax=Candidatus Ichthyocystis hellenicum TaxID=1561003 RepID=UPI000B8667EB|nr:hypothetical protein [Candidatus Ichthyocystis hellenicum]
MSAVGCFAPCALLELSIKSVFGVSCKESINILMQLSHDEIVDAAILVKRRKVSFSIYDPICESISEVDNLVCPFPVNWVEFCVNNCSLSDNPRELSTLLGFMNKINLIILCADYITGEDRSKVLSIIAGNVVTDVPLSMIFMFCAINSLINGLKMLPFRRRNLLKSQFIKTKCEIFHVPLVKILRKDILGRYDKLLWCLLASALLQLKQSFSLLGDSLDYGLLYEYFINGGAEEVGGREETVSGMVMPENMGNFGEEGEESTLFRATARLSSFLADIDTLKLTILPVIHVCNFIPLEDMLKMFKRKGSDLCKAQIYLISSFLRKKYLALIKSRKFKIECLKKNVPNNVKMEGALLDLVYTDTVNSKLAERLKKEVEGMERFIKNFHEDAPRVRKRKIT